MRTGHSGVALLQCLLTALPESAKRVVFGELATDALSCDSVLACLQREYGGDAVLEQREALHTYRKCVRVSTESLGEFLKRHRHARQVATLAGVLVPNAATDTWDLLEACSLSATQRSNFIGQLQMRTALQPDTSELDHAIQLLTNLARAFGTEQSQPSTALLAASTPGLALESAHSHVAGKGGKGELKGGWPKGGWKKSAKGGWKKKGGKGQGAGGAGGKGKGQGAGGKSKGDQGSAKKKDWTCPACQASCWGSKDKCFKCGANKPERAVGSGAPSLG